MAFKLGDEEGFRWVGAYEISTDELLDGKEGKATETKLERGAKLIRELLAICNQTKYNEEKREGDIYGKNSKCICTC